MLSIRPVRPGDTRNLSVLIASTFGQANEANLVQALRDGGHVAIELLAEDDDGIVGHICFSELLAPAAWLALAPVSVRMAQQGRGVGSELIRYGLDAARRNKAPAVVVVGNPAYYRRFGFVFDGPAQLVSPYPRPFTGLYPLAPDIADFMGTLVYPPPFEEV